MYQPPKLEFWTLYLHSNSGFTDILKVQYVLKEVFHKQRRHHATKHVNKSEKDQEMLSRAMGHTKTIHDRDYVKVIIVCIG